MLQFEFLDPAAQPCSRPLAVTIGERIACRLADGCHLTRGAISALLADETGVGSWGTVRFVEGRLRLASLAPCIFEALAEGAITLDMAKAYGAVSDTERQAHDGIVEPLDERADASSKPASYSQRLLDELAMQRRDVLAIHLANDPALALDLMVFTLADADGHDWRARKAITIVGPASGPVSGFEAKDAPASSVLAEFTGSLDESWRAGPSDVDRFAAFRALSDEARSLWLGFVVARTLIASLNAGGERGIPLHDALGALLEIEMAHWWRPTAANFFDRVPKARILEAFDAVGGPELVSRYAGSKKADLASPAERIFSGEFIGEKDVKAQALAWVPAVMRFGTPKEEATGDDETSARSDDANDDLIEQAAYPS